MPSHAPLHLEKSLQHDIDNICSKIQEMSGLGEMALEKALQALINRDRKLAYSVILCDRYIDELDTELDRLCLEFFVRQLPVAGHLRFIFATTKIVRDLERIGDYAESIARQVLQLFAIEPPISIDKFIDDFRGIANLSIPMLHDSIQAFINRDVKLARLSMETEAKADDIRSDINSKLARLRQQGYIPLEALTPLLTITRRYERVTDQAKNICEEVIYMTTGEIIKHKGAHVFRILFVDDDNSCCSQMAEAIGRSLGLSSFSFCSAGTKDAKPVHPGLVEFMAGKGVDISRYKSKTLNQISDIEYVQVIVALEHQFRDIKASIASKATGLDWLMPKICKYNGGDREIEVDFDKAYEYLHSNLVDLVQAVIGESEGRKNENKH